MQPLILSETEWRKRLSPAQYGVLREGRSERAFTGRYTDTQADGVYHCAACRSPLFDSADKFDSGTGWPSFTRPLAPDRVTDHRGVSRGRARVETRCACCDGHLGHVFPNGPPPIGLSYRLNSVSLEFRAREANASN